MRRTYTYIEEQNQLTIFCPATFRFSINLAYLSRSDNECMYVATEEVVERAVYVDHQWFLIRVFSLNDVDLTVQFIGTNATVSAKALDEVYDFIVDWFDLTFEIELFYEIAKRDRLLKQPAETFYGLRIMGIPDLFEALVWGILGQQINLQFAYTLKRRFVETFGEKMEQDEKTYWLFPTADYVSTLDVEDLTILKTSTKKAEYIIGIAQLLASNQLTKQQLMEVETMAEAEQILTSIRGIGPWTANYVLMRCLRFREAFPIDDVGFHNAVKDVGGYDAKPDKQTLKQLAIPWKGYESYAVFYLWKWLY